MDERVEKWLYDALQAIDEIESFHASAPKDLGLYKQNILLKRATERELEIIGEAINRIKKYAPDTLTSISESDNIVGMRNQVIHAYDSISDEIVWAVVIRHIPKLKTEIQSLLGE